MRHPQPFHRHQAITPSNTTTYQYMQAVRADGAGTLVLKDAAGTTITYTVAAGVALPIQATQVLAASTATGITGWF